ncbi:MAG: PhnD/SsuA/transferrin family substrate-binding protein [Atopobiaceae bacterium]|nr:PhnD/SsuA/transferrin family substrate-binding protein [Atopobiaceae bacterium]
MDSKLTRRNFVLGSASVASLALAACGGGQAQPEASKSEASASASASAAEASASASEASASTSSAAGAAIDKLSIMYVPSRPADEIISTTSGLKDILIEKLGEAGYQVGSVEIAVSDNYNAAGEALAAGTADIGYVPGGTYALFGDDMNLLLTATRDNLIPDTFTPSDWNGQATKREEGVPVTYYKGLIWAGPSETGQALAAKANNGEEISWEEISAANWGVGSLTSNASYIYPNLWLEETYGKKITDLPNVTIDMKQADAFMQLASGETIDIFCAYADARMDYEESWTGEWGRSEDIWHECNVIGVTPNIYNDTICLAKTGPNADVLNSSEFQTALADIFMGLADTDEGKEIIGIYSHTGYQPANDSDYDAARDALAAME